MADAILFETEESAQAILDKHFPGYTVTVAVGNNHCAIIQNKQQENVVRMSW